MAVEQQATSCVYVVLQRAQNKPLAIERLSEQFGLLVEESTEILRRAPIVLSKCPDPAAAEALKSQLMSDALEVVVISEIGLTEKIPRVVWPDAPTGQIAVSDGLFEDKGLFAQKTIPQSKNLSAFEKKVAQAHQAYCDLIEKCDHLLNDSMSQGERPASGDTLKVQKEIEVREKNIRELRETITALQKENQFAEREIRMRDIQITTARDRSQYFLMQLRKTESLRKNLALYFQQAVREFEALQISQDAKHLELEAKHAQQIRALSAETERGAELERILQAIKEKLIEKDNEIHETAGQKAAAEEKFTIFEKRHEEISRQYLESQEQASRALDGKDQKITTLENVISNERAKAEESEASLKIIQEKLSQKNDEAERAEKQKIFFEEKADVAEKKLEQFRAASMRELQEERARAEQTADERNKKIIELEGALRTLEESLRANAEALEKSRSETVEKNQRLEAAINTVNGANEKIKEIENLLIVTKIEMEKSVEEAKISALQKQTEIEGCLEKEREEKGRVIAGLENQRSALEEEIRKKDLCFETEQKKFEEANKNRTAQAEEVKSLKEFLSAKEAQLLTASEEAARLVREQQVAQDDLKMFVLEQDRRIMGESRKYSALEEAKNKIFDELKAEREQVNKIKASHEAIEKKMEEIGQESFLWKKEAAALGEKVYQLETGSGGGISRERDFESLQLRYAQLEDVKNEFLKQLALERERCRRLEEDLSRARAAQSILDTSPEDGFEPTASGSGEPGDKQNRMALVLELEDQRSSAQEWKAQVLELQKEIAFLREQIHKFK